MPEETEKDEHLERIFVSMHEDPIGGCKGAINGLLICIGMIGAAWLIWWLTHR